MTNNPIDNNYQNLKITLPVIIEISKKDGQTKQKVSHQRQPSLPIKSSSSPKSLRTTKSLAPFALKNKSEQLNEMPISKLGDEIINDDLQFFLAFCSLVYLMRSVVLIYCVTKSIDNKNETNQTEHYLIYEIIDMIFAIACVSTSITGFIYSWMLNVAFIIPFAISLALSTLFVLFKLFKTILYDLSENTGVEKLLAIGILLELGFFFMNFLIAIFVTKLYNQIEERDRIYRTEPSFVKIGKRCYQMRKVISVNQTKVIYELIQDNNNDKLLDKTTNKT